MTDPVRPSVPARPRRLKPVAAWHGAWTAASALLAVAAVMGLGHPPVEPLLGWGLGVMVLPGLAGLFLQLRDGWNERALVLAGWGLAALAASALSGGATGSLAGSLFMPVAAGLVLGDSRLSQAGALTTVLAAGVGLLSSLLGGTAAAEPLLAAIVVALTGCAMAAAAGIAWARSRSDVKSAAVSQGRVEALLAGQPGLILVVETDGAVAAAYGAPPPALSLETLFARGLTAAIDPADAPLVRAAIDRALSGPAAQAFVRPLSAMDRRLLLFFKKIEAPGAPVRLVVQAYDGAVQYAREAALEAARVEADARNAGKSRFLANMSHELRTPLNAIIGFSDIIRQRLFGPLPDRYGGYADSIHEAGGHLLDLINDVLDMSKIEADRYELSPERFDAREVVSSALALVRVQADDKAVALTGILPPDAVWVQADRRALKQMALNLLSNALKFTPAGGSVTATLEAVGPYCELVVSDTGVGIAPEDLQRLGRPFEQAGGTEQRLQGTGLGLSLVRSLAELHGGRMTIDSTLGAGTAVTVRMPVTAQAPAEASDGVVVPFKTGG